MMIAVLSRAAAPSALLHDLAMEREVHAVALRLGIDAQADRDIDELQDDVARDRAIAGGNGDAIGLGQHLPRMAVDEAALALAADRRHREDAGQQRADDAADAVHAEGIEAVVVTEGMLEAGRAPIAGKAGGEADGEPARGIDEARGRGDGDEPGDGARDDAEHRGLAALRPLEIG